MKMKSAISVGLLIVLLACAAPRDAGAWAEEGHRIVARIASRLVSARVRNAAVRVLTQPAPDPFLAKCASQQLPVSSAADKLACVANWADAVRNAGGHLATAEDHFVNIPITDPGFDPKFCTKGCVVDAIDRMKKALLDPATPPDKRREALKYLIHFVGDLHQPLHTALDDDRDLTADGNPQKNLDDGQGDRGANRKIAKWLGDEANQFGCWNVHAVWDAGIIEQTGGKEQTFAKRLGDRLTPAKRQQLEGGDTVAWTNEAFKLAVNHAYKDLTPVGGDPNDLVCQIEDAHHAKQCVAFESTVCAKVEVHRRYTLDRSYFDNNKGIVDDQLTAAGVRLAKLLREVFK